MVRNARLSASTRLKRLAVLSAAVAILLGCASGGSAPEFVGRIVSAVEWKLPPDVFAALTSQPNQLAQAGITIAGSNLRMRDTGIPGLMVVIGDEVYVTDDEGYFGLDAIPAGATEGRVYKRADPAAPYEVFPLSSLARPGQQPTPLRMTFVYAGPVGMNNRAQLEALGFDCQNCDGGPTRANGVNWCAGAGNTRPCCEDQDGPYNDGNWYTDGYDPRRIKNFIGST